MNLAEHRKNLNRLANLIHEEQICLPEESETLKRALKLADEKFLVVVVGVFNCGKSSMINALIGEELLTRGFLPETAAFTELHDCTEKRVIVCPKNGDEPFTIEPTIEEIAKYVSFGVEPESHTDIKLDKVIIKWPWSLNTFKGNVVFVDTPALLDNHYIKNYIIENYLPGSDAVVYVMDSTRAYSKADKDYLETLNALGMKNIITAYTFYDGIRLWERKHKDPQKLQKLRTRLVEYMTKHTELGVESIHFLASLEGLDAKFNNDPVKWRKSGFEGFENYLSQYLVDSKGKAQVRRIVNAIVSEAELSIETLDRLNAAATEEDFRQQLSEAEQNLQEVREISERMIADYRERSARCLNEAKVMVRQFVMQELPQRVNLEDFTPETQLPEGVARLWSSRAAQTRATIQAAFDECREEIRHRANLEFKKWCKDTLENYLHTAFDDDEAFEHIKFDLLRVKIFGKPQTYRILWSTSGPIYPTLGIINRLPYETRRDLINEIKNQELNAFRERAIFSAWEMEVDALTDKIWADIEFCINSAGIEAERALKSKVKKAEQTVRQICDRKKIDSAVADRLHDIKKCAVDIGAEYDIHDLFRRRI